MIKQPISTGSLHRYLLQFLSNEDIIQLCTELGLDYEDFVTIGGGRSYTLLRLLNYYRRRSVLMPQFYAALHTLRPDIDLAEYGGPVADFSAVESPPSPSYSDPDPSDNVIQVDVVQYENFDLLISTAGRRGRYFINARHSHAGGAGTYAVQELDLDQEAFQQLKLYLEKLAVRPEDLKVLGTILYNFLFPPNIAQLFQALYEMMRQAGRGVRIRLSVQPAELNSIPWEYCYVPINDSFFAKNVDTPVVRLIQQPYVSDSLAADGKLRVLIVLSSPVDLSPLNIEYEENLIRQALEPISDLIELSVLHHPTGPGLYQTVDQINPHILHFVGHGRYKNGVGSLVIERDDGRARYLSADQLADILHNRATRVVVLNACETATASEDSPAFNSVAQALVYRRIPAVIAMQFNVPDRLASRFAEALYQQIAQGEPLDRAVTEMRIQASLGESEMDQLLWGIPVLFMRGSDGKIWKRLPAGIQSAASQNVLASRPPLGFTKVMSEPDQTQIKADLNILLERLTFVRLREPEWGDVLKATNDIEAELAEDSPNLRRISRKLNAIADIFNEAQVGLADVQRIQDLMGQIDQIGD